MAVPDATTATPRLGPGRDDHDAAPSVEHGARDMTDRSSELSKIVINSWLASRPPSRRRRGLQTCPIWPRRRSPDPGASLPRRRDRPRQDRRIEVIRVLARLVNRDRPPPRLADRLQELIAPEDRRADPPAASAADASFRPAADAATGTSPGAPNCVEIGPGIAPNPRYFRHSPPLGRASGFVRRRDNSPPLGPLPNPLGRRLGRDAGPFRKSSLSPGAGQISWHAHRLVVSRSRLSAGRPSTPSA